MKTTSIFIIASIGMFTNYLTITLVCVLLVAYLFWKWELSKTTKVERSENSFQNVINEKCDCENPCNEYCSKK